MCELEVKPVFGTLPEETGVETAPLSVRVIQLDLARQMETVSFITRFLSFAKESGYTHVQLYLEGRIRTKSFPFRPLAETYSEDEIRTIADAAGNAGIDLVPVISLLGHAENFVNCPELADICEENLAGRGRFGINVPKMTFCTSNPRTREFLESYLEEVLALFPGRNFHVGLDESFNTGFCPQCAERMKREGLGGIYLETILWAHSFLTSRGRRMWMWDDFCEFFPEKTPQIPRDVVRCNWYYDEDITEARGPRGHFGDRFRCDWFRLYRKLGADALFCPGYGAKSMTSFTEYSRRNGAKGAIFTMWEMQTLFHARTMIIARAAGLFWSTAKGAITYDEALDHAVSSLYPTLGALEKKAVRTLVDSYSDASWKLAIEILRNSALNPGDGEISSDPFSEEAMVDDLVTSAEVSVLEKCIGEIQRWTVSPSRTASTVRAAKERAAFVEGETIRLAARRMRQEQVWRPGCLPGGLSSKAERLKSILSAIRGEEERGAGDDEWQLEMSFLLEDYHGVPFWTVEGLSDGKWRELASGSWKPEPGKEYCYFERAVRFFSQVPPERLRISYHGYNDAGMTYISAANRKMSLVPTAVCSFSGRIANIEAILTDNIEPVRFGDPDCTSQILFPERADGVSTLEVSLCEEFPEGGNDER